MIRTFLDTEVLIKIDSSDSQYPSHFHASVDGWRWRDRPYSGVPSTLPSFKCRDRSFD
jgi:hypothetical protein